MTTVHLGDHETDCDICKMNCGCRDCEKNDNEKLSECFICKTVLDLDDYGEGGHMFEGKVVCSPCEGNYEEV